MGIEPGASVGDGGIAPTPVTAPTPVVTPSFDGFAHTAVGGGFIRVLVDGVEVSKHTQQHKAAESAEARKRAEPGARVTYKPEFEIEVTLK